MSETTFQYVPYEILNTERKKLSRLYTFIWRYIGKTISLSHGSHYAMGLFSNDGLLLDLFARENYTLEYLMKDGIRAGSNWKTIGHNAVRQGIISKESLSTIGDENELPILKKYAIYYAPISILSPYEPYDQMEECGMGIITTLDNAWDDYLTMIRGTAHDMMITLQFNNIATMYYERSGKGILSIDNMMSSSGRNLATYYNDELFKVLEIPPVQIYYEPVEDLIDPLPANKELWDIVQNHKTIANQPLSVTCKGKTVDLIASTDAYNQPMINAHGVVFYFTTPQKMTAELSRQVANGAIKTFDDIVGKNKELKRLIEKARRMAQTDSNIMILGESGTGKDVFAQAIHNASSRRGKPFIALNCGALPRDLVESELFGYETGAFTGARKNGNIGKFELANGGTIFLDEIGEMPLDLQAKLLRVTESRQLMRLGGSKNIKVDVRIIAATNANIEDMIEQKLFRADLFYRLSTMKLYLMPLRERRDDIVPLAEHFIRSITQRIGKPNVMHFSENAKELIQKMDWFGNVRELQNLIECIVQLYPGDIILPEYILDNVSERYHPQKSTLNTNYNPASDTVSETEASSHKAIPNTHPNHPDRKEEMPKTGFHKRKHLTREDLSLALAACGNNRTEASKYLGISRRTLYRKLEEYGLDYEA
ncbi:MAG: sigma-54 interaction domain-containing protein [Oliverpabstia sp.]